ncbi:MAG: HlyD family secretion protein [Candidatus Eremiobacteraeota bacterium]|nr:HlyD family secretion protein [Candidatus Eremiobacteraeota bacterium]MCW5871152.1 HlyD family secretion protein [Candidatus Eremiobacteraeota bacterium]
MSSDVPSARRPWGWLFLILLAAAAVWWWVKYAPGSTPEVELLDATVEKGNITATVSATGALEAITTVTVGSQVSGPVREVRVDFNSQVQTGQVLAVLDPSEFQAKVQEAEAGLEVGLAGAETANARLANSRAAIAQSETQVEVARNTYTQNISMLEGARANLRNSTASVTKAKAEMDNALLEYKRYEQLYANQLVAASERDQKRTAYRVAGSGYESSLANEQSLQAQVRTSQAQLLQAKNNVISAEAKLQADRANVQAAQAELNSAQARIRQYEATLQRARVDLQRTVIRSPVDGTVIDRKIEPGQTVAASFTAPELFKIARDLRRMQVRADVSEADIGRVFTGQKVTFTVDAYPEDKFEGKVTQVRSAPVSANTNQNNVVVYGVLISAPNPKLLLKPGMTATVAVAAEELKDVLLVPDEALRFLPPNPPDPEEEKKAREKEKNKEKDKQKKPRRNGRAGVVWVPGKTGPQRRDILIGVSDGQFSELVEGDLKVGDKVYTKILDEEKLKRKKVRLAF